MKTIRSFNFVLQLVNHVLFGFSGDELLREDLGAGSEPFQGPTPNISSKSPIYAQM